MTDRLDLPTFEYKLIDGKPYYHSYYNSPKASYGFKFKDGKFCDFIYGFKYEDLNRNGRKVFKVLVRMIMDINYYVDDYDTACKIVLSSGTKEKINSSVYAGRYGYLNASDSRKITDRNFYFRDLSRTGKIYFHNWISYWCYLGGRFDEKYQEGVTKHSADDFDEELPSFPEIVRPDIGLP